MQVYYNGQHVLVIAFCLGGISMERPLPLINEDCNWHWEGLREKKFLVQKCKKCNRFRWPISPVCPSCFSEHMEISQIEGKGKIVSWAVFHYPYYQYFKDKLPYTVVQVETPEQIRITANLLKFDYKKVEFGMDVKMVFEQVSDEIILPQFIPL